MVNGRFECRLPPFQDIHDETEGRFDSNLVIPAKSDNGQTNWESVIFKGEQAYPAFLVKFTLA